MPVPIFIPMPDVDSPAVISAPLQILWGAIVAGAVLAVGVLGALSLQSAPPAPRLADGLFYGAAALNVGAIAAAFALLRRMEARLVGGHDPSATIRLHGLLALAVLETSALLGAVAAFVGGATLGLAFVVPLVAFAALTWPSETRVAGWLRLAER